MKKPNGIELYRGPSAIDGKPIVCLLTGLKTGSANRKTGGMIQTYILRADVEPTEVLRRGLDPTVCGSCPHRSKASGGQGSCYVNVGRGPLAVWRCWKRGGYPRLSLGWTRTLIWESGRGLRIGTYGDPGAVPGDLWAALASAARFHTGYTHRWQQRRDLREICMASTDNAEQTEKAWTDGWATFRVARKGDALRLAGEARCPASAEAGKRTECAGCPIRCDGSQRRGNLGRVIQAHGAMASCCTGK